MNRSPLRRLVRRLRDGRALGWAIRAVDRVWWWRTIRRSGLVDARFYAAQLGVPRLAADLAILHYVARGFRRGLSLNPLFDEITAGGHLPEVFRVPAMYAYLLSDRETVPIHPLWDAPAHGRAHRLVDTAPLEHAWSDQGASLRLEAAGRARSVSVSELRESAIAFARSWRSGGRTDRDVADRADRLVLRVVQKRDRRYGLKLVQAARLAEDPATRVVVALVSPDASQWIVARELAATCPGLTIVRYRARARWNDVVRDAVDLLPSEVVVALDPRAEFDDEELDELTAHARVGRAAAPVSLESDGTIAGAGAARVDGFARPYRILCGHAPEDLAGWGAEPTAVPALTGRSFAMPAGALRDAVRTAAGQGLEALSRAARASGVECVVLPHRRALPIEPLHAFAAERDRAGSRPASSPRQEGERARELLGLAGFDVQSWGAGPGGRPLPLLTWRRPNPGAQRWAIKTCAPAGRAGAVWGDTHFAVGLARALRRRGHEVVIDAFGASRRPSAYLDDVSIVVRGPYRVDPPDTGVRIEWIISHPDEITAAEVRRFDIVFAASRRWAADASARFSYPILPLLEATDTDQFHPRGRLRGDDIVFVGTARGIPRPCVVAPLAAGIPVKVYGPDWRPFISSSAVVAESLPNAELPERYETASIVLNDQWSAMREHGFIAMRPFDVVAVGGRVISEQVDEIEEIFEGAVVTYRDTAHLVELLRSDPAELFPAEAVLSGIGRRIREGHSFDARAATIIDAIEARGVRDGGAGTVG